MCLRCPLRYRGFEAANVLLVGVFGVSGIGECFGEPVQHGGVRADHGDEKNLGGLRSIPAVFMALACVRRVPRWACGGCLRGGVTVGLGRLGVRVGLQVDVQHMGQVGADTALAARLLTPRVGDTHPGTRSPARLTIRQHPLLDLAHASHGIRQTRGRGSDRAAAGMGGGLHSGGVRCPGRLQRVLRFVHGDLRVHVRLVSLGLVPPLDCPNRPRLRFRFRLGVGGLALPLVRRCGRPRLRLHLRRRGPRVVGDQRAEGVRGCVGVSTDGVRRVWVPARVLRPVRRRRGVPDRRLDPLSTDGR